MDTFNPIPAKIGGARSAGRSTARSPAVRARRRRRWPPRLLAGRALEEEEEAWQPQPRLRAPALQIRERERERGDREMEGAERERGGGGEGRRREGRLGC